MVKTLTMQDHFRGKGVNHQSDVFGEIKYFKTSQDKDKNKLSILVRQKCGGCDHELGDGQTERDNVWDNI